MGYRIGIDVGGTFTDLICITPDGTPILDKTPSTPQDQSLGVITGLGQLATRLGAASLADFATDIDIVVHGTTTADNTMIEQDGAVVGLLTTEGHRDEIEMRRVHKEQIWDPSYPAPFAIARRRARIPIPERLDHTGAVLVELDEDAVRAGIARLRALGCESLAVMYLHSVIDPRHELRTAELIAQEWPEVGHVSLSHQVMARGPEFERVSTTLVNAYVAPRLTNYVDRLVVRLHGVGYHGSLLIMASTGGVVLPEQVGRRAVGLLGSGPAGGVMAAAAAARADDVGDFVAVDMGGTSCDLCLVRDGRPVISTDWNWRYRYYIGLPMVDVQCVGAGGGSIARVRQGVLSVGPESAGAAPGPACYGRGGDEPTVTDADAVLGYLPVDRFAAGRMPLDVDAARDAICHHVAEPMGTDVIDAAWGIERIVNSNMANATRRVLAASGADPRRLCLIAYGGNGPVHAWAIAAELGMTRVLVPKAAPGFSALGLLVSDHKADLTHSMVSPLSLVAVDRLGALLDAVVADADAELAPAGLDRADISTERFVQMSYPGQSFDMSVPAGTLVAEDDLMDLGARFHDLHEAERGFSFPAQEPTVRGVRVVLTGVVPKPPSLRTTGPTVARTSGDAGVTPALTRPVHFGAGFIDTPIHDGTALIAGAVIAGPALIEEPFTVIVVPPGATCRLTADAAYDIALAPDQPAPAPDQPEL